MTVEQINKDSQSLTNIQECVMIATIRTFDYSHDVQFKVCTIIMLNATSLIQPPKTTSTHNVLHISYKDAFTQTQHRLCVSHCIHSLTPTPIGPTPTHTQMSPILHEAAHTKGQFRPSLLSVCLCMQGSVCSLL